MVVCTQRAVLAQGVLRSAKGGTFPKTPRLASGLLVIPSRWSNTTTTTDEDDDEAKVGKSPSIWKEDAAVNRKVTGCIQKVLCHPSCEGGSHGMFSV